MDLVIANRQRKRKINLRRLRQIVSGLCAELGIPEITLGIHLVGASEMTRVNETFLRHAGSTDVITFDHSDPVTGLRPATSPLHGELFVCVDEAGYRPNNSGRAGNRKWCATSSTACCTFWAMTTDGRPTGDG